MTLMQVAVDDNRSTRRVRRLLYPVGDAVIRITPTTNVEASANSNRVGRRSKQAVPFMRAARERLQKAALRLDHRRTRDALLNGIRARQATPPGNRVDRRETPGDDSKIFGTKHIRTIPGRQTAETWPWRASPLPTA